MEAILTRPNLRQIDFGCSYPDASNIDQEFPKNFAVEEITIMSFNHNLNIRYWKRLFDALPNTKRVRVFHASSQKPILICILEFLKITGEFKNLKSLHFAMYGHNVWFSVQQIQDCCKIIANYPIKAKVVIAYSDEDGANVSNRIEKDEGKLPKKVKFWSQSWYPLSGSSFFPKPM